MNNIRTDVHLFRSAASKWLISKWLIEKDSNLIASVGFLKPEERAFWRTTRPDNLNEDNLRATDFSVCASIPSHVMGETMIESPPTVSFFKALGVVSCAIPVSIVVGTVFGQSAEMLQQLMDPESHIRITKDEATWIASTAILGELTGSLICGRLADIFGRIRMFQLSLFLGAIGYATIAASSNFDHLILGRFLMGLGAGAYFPGVIYVSETSPPKYRGLFLSISPLFSSVGMALMYTIGGYLPWNIAAVVVSVISTLSFIATFLYRDSPQWLVQRGRIVDAEESLKRMEHPANVAKRLKEILDAKASNEKQGGKKLGFEVFLEPAVWKPFLMITALSILQCSSGYYTVVFYTLNFLTEFGTEFDATKIMTAFGVTRILSSVLCCALLRRSGRCTVGAISGFASALVLLVMYGFLRLRQNCPDLVVDYSWVPAYCLIAFILSTGIGVYPLPWIMPNELFPLKVRGLMCGTCFSLMTVYMFVPIKLYNFMIDGLGLEVFSCIMRRSHCNCHRYHSWPIGTFVAGVNGARKSHTNHKRGGNLD